MMGHKICLYGEIWLIIPKLSLLPFLIWRLVIYLKDTDGMANSVDPDQTPSAPDKKG